MLTLVTSQIDLQYNTHCRVVFVSLHAFFSFLELFRVTPRVPRNRMLRNNCTEFIKKVYFQTFENNCCTERLTVLNKQQQTSLLQWKMKDSTKNSALALKQFSFRTRKGPTTPLLRHQGRTPNNSYRVRRGHFRTQAISCRQLAPIPSLNECVILSCCFFSLDPKNW